MITIELIDESKSRSEKPAHRIYEYNYHIEDKYYNPVRMLVENQRDDLLRAARDARLLNKAKRHRQAVDVRRYVDRVITGLVDLIERSVRRLGYLHTPEASQRYAARKPGEE